MLLWLCTAFYGNIGRGQRPQLMAAARTDPDVALVHHVTNLPPHQAEYLFVDAFEAVDALDVTCVNWWALCQLVPSNEFITMAIALIDGVALAALPAMSSGGRAFYRHFQVGGSCGLLCRPCLHT